MSCAFLTSNTGANGSNVDESGASYTLDSSCGQAIAFKHFAGSKAGGVGYGEDMSPTLTDSSAHQPAVAFAQNSRDEVRLVGGNGDVAGALCADNGAKQQTYVATQYGDVAASPTARHDSSACPDRGQTIVSMMDLQANSTVEEGLLGTLTAHIAKGAAIIAQPVNSAGEDVVGTLCAGDEKLLGDQMVRQGKVVAEPNGCGWTVRRLTPLECERLQGFPDNWTAIEGARDAPRYKAIGNSMAVPVMRWIGERIEKVEEAANGA